MPAKSETKLPARRQRIPDKLRRKLQDTIRASLGNVSAHTERSYRRGLVVFSKWLVAEGIDLPIPLEAAPRHEERLSWELLAIDVAGAWLCSLDERTANTICDRFVRDLLGFEKDGQFAAAPLSRATVERHLAAMRWAVKQAYRMNQVDWKLTTQLPGARKDKEGRLLEKEGRDMRGPSSDDVEALLEAARNSADPRALPIVSLLRFEGYREHEIRQLDIKNFDPDAATLSLVRKKREKLAVYPISAATLDAILRWLGQHPSPTKGPLFTGGRLGVEPRTRIGSTTIWRLVGRIAAAAGLPSTSPHRIRHRACTDLVHAGLRAGLPEEELLFLTGHSSRSALYPYYEANKDRAQARGVLNSVGKKGIIPS